MATQQTTQRLERMLELERRQRPILPVVLAVVAAVRVPCAYAMVAAVVLRQWAAGTMPRSLVAGPDGWALAALLLLGAGLALRAWAAGTLRKNRVLSTIGPYALCRHPLYAGSALILAGACLLAGDGITAGLLLGPAALVYVLTMRREEAQLAQQFGPAWEAYRARVPCLFPCHWPAGLWAGWSFAQWRHNQECRAVLGALALLAAIEIAHALHG